MAKTLKITFDWENDNFFEMTSKEDEAEKISVIRIEENAHIDDMWLPVSTACKSFVGTEIDKIGAEMKK